MKKQIDRADACERMNRLSCLSRKNNRKGFSLAEALIAVAIIVVLLAIAIPSVIAIRKRTRQTELDTKAEIIYEAVQNQLIKMRSNGNSDIFQPKTNADGTVAENQVFKLGFAPWDQDSSNTVQAADLSFITSDELIAPNADGTNTTAAWVIMEEGIVDSELRGNSWVIEFNPASGSVYAVFYSEDDSYDLAATYKSEVSTPDVNTLDRSMRNKENRLADGARVGYYTGNSIAKLNNVKSVRPELTIENAEKLTLSIACTVPLEVTDCPVIKVQIEDIAGNKNVKYYTHWSTSEATKQALSNEVSGLVLSRDLTLTGTLDVRTYSFTLTLDDLSEESTRFTALYGEQSRNASGVREDGNDVLYEGSPLKITVSALCPGNGSVTGNSKTVGYTNGLFGDANNTVENGSKEELNEAYGSEGYPAIVTYGRHLQNMDSSSGVNNHLSDEFRIGYYTQGSDIFFDEIAIAEGVQDWYETYHTAYFNGTVDGNANFKPIQNAAMVSFTGRMQQESGLISYSVNNLHVQAAENAGLFEFLYPGQSLNYVNLIGAKVAGGKNFAAGTLAGYIKGESEEKVQLNHCQSYLSNSDILGKDNHDIWVSGSAAVGGLIGNVSGGNVVIDSCSASTVLGTYTFNESTMVATQLTSSYAGGLVGVLQGGNVSIKKSYADNYVAGQYAGGLVGCILDGEVSINDSYAAGFITFIYQGAGFAAYTDEGLTKGNLTAANSYSIMFRQYLKDEDTPYYAIARKGSIPYANVYYQAAEKVEALQGTSAITSSDDLYNKLTGFVRTNTGSRAYNLMGQTLTAYSYPGILGVTHYGDWKAEFKPGALVYYEVYDDGTIGFYGANVASSLKDDKIIVGDGYGVIYLQNEFPEKLTIQFDNNTVALNLKSYKATYGSDPLVTADGYKIFPLDATIVNAEAKAEDFYTRVMITADNTNKDYYFYNPLFAKSVVTMADESVTTLELKADSIVTLRTARHLYNMSKWYYRMDQSTKDIVFMQERNIDYSWYSWTEYTMETTGVTSQRPIGTSDADGNVEAFISTYDGRGNWITNVNISSNGIYTGLFGINNGTIQNVVVTAVYDANNKCFVAKNGSVSRNQKLYQGILVGSNGVDGYIYNTAVSGYSLTGLDGTIHAYDGSYVYVGALAGSNDGIIENCSADTPDLRISANYANVYAGGFIGLNNGSVRNCYALGHIGVVDAKGGSVSIAGFAGRNGGVIRDSYCATALTAGGETTTSYGFAPNGGTTLYCNYLNGGTYSFVNHMYAYNTILGSGKPVLYGNMKLNLDREQSDDYKNQAVYSYNFQNTNTEGVTYPFKAVVRNMAGELVHYGDWLDDEELGSVGFFYWEHEVGGSNDGYHLTFLGAEGSSVYGGTTLCVSHDDGGVITEYGYGYYEKNLGSTTMSIDGAVVNGGSKFTALYPADNMTYEKALEYSTVNKAASLALSEQLFYNVDDAEVPYFFFAFNTRTATGATSNDNGNYLCMNRTDTGRNATFKLQYTMATAEDNTETHTYEYVACVFFADAMQISKIDEKAVTENVMVTGFDEDTTNYKIEPGLVNSSTTNDNPYVIRSISQLQFINWNTNKQTYTDTLSRFTNGKYYVYESASNGDASPSNILQFVQNHDILNPREGDRSALFYPLGRSNRAFKMHYNGNSYQIKNLWIEETTSSYVGLFGQLGETAFLENMVLTADYENRLGKICGIFDSSNDVDQKEPAIGAFAGMLYSSRKDSDQNLLMENCSASGYIIEFSGNMGIFDNPFISMGGLVGTMLSCAIKNCSAVNDIQMNASLPTSKQQHIGGLVGSTGINLFLTGWDGIVRSYITNCYSGGQISTISNAEAFLGGLVGNVRSRQFIPSSIGLDLVPYLCHVDNCYTYCKSQAEWYSYDTLFTDPHYRNDRHPLCGNVVLIGNKGITNSYFLERNEARLKYESSAVTFETMCSDSFIKKLNNNADGPFARVTTTEGDNEINGKYSYPSSSHLDGKNYPFPAVLTQQDLNFNRSVMVHYGDWVLEDAYWTEGRASMDIFADMQTSGNNQGYAVKIFKINLNENMDINTSNVKIAVADTQIAQVVSVNPIYTENYKVMEEGKEVEKTRYLLPVEIKANNVGSTIISMTAGDHAASFVLEVTAELDISAAVNNKTVDEISLAMNENQAVTLSAMSCADDAINAIDYSTNANGSWNVISEDSNIVSAGSTDTMNIWKVERQGLGETMVEVRYTYNYPGGVDANGQSVTIPFTNSVYINVVQPDTIGLSDNTRYNVTFVGTTGTGMNYDYTKFKPECTTGDFYLYSSSKDVITKLGVGTIDKITIGEGENAEIAVYDASKNCYTTAKDGSEVGYYVQFDNDILSDENYWYKTGTIYHITDEEVPSNINEVKLGFVINDTDELQNPSQYSLSIPLESIANKKIITIKYVDSENTEYSYSVTVKSGDPVVLMTPGAIAENANFTVVSESEKRFAGWTEQISEEEVKEYNTTDTYTFENSITLVSKWVDVRYVEFVTDATAVTWKNINPSGYYDVGSTIDLPALVDKNDMGDFTVSGNYGFEGWYDNAECIGTKLNYVVVADAKDEETGTQAPLKIYAACYRNVSITLLDKLGGELHYTLDPANKPAEGSAIPGNAKIWAFNKKSTYSSRYQGYIDAATGEPSALLQIPNGFELLGWYIGSNASPGTDDAPGVMLMDAQGNYVPNVIIDGVTYTNDKGVLTFPDNIENVCLYAYWGKTAGAEQRAYVAASSLERDEVYLITDGEYALSVTATAGAGESAAITMGSKAITVNYSELYSKYGKAAAAIEVNDEAKLGWTLENVKVTDSVNADVLSNVPAGSETKIYVYGTENGMVASDAVNVSAADWKYDAGVQRLYIEKNGVKYWLGCKLDTTYPENPVSTGEFVLYVEKAEENIDNVITKSYIYTKTEVYSQATFNPQYTVKMDLLGDQTNTVEFKVYAGAAKMDAAVISDYLSMIDGYSALSGWVVENSTEAGLEKIHVSVTSENGQNSAVMKDANAADQLIKINSDLNLVAEWTVNFHTYTAQTDANGGVTYQDAVEQLSFTSKNVPTKSAPEGASGWYTFAESEAAAAHVYSADRATILINADGTVAAKDNLFRTTDVYAAYTVTLHDDATAIEETNTYYVDSYSVEEALLCNGVSSRVQGWYTKDSDGYVAAADNGLINVLKKNELYAGWKVNLHIVSDPDPEKAIKIIAMADTKRVTVPDTLVLVLGDNFKGWYAKSADDKAVSIDESRPISAYEDLWAGWTIRLHYGLTAAKDVEEVVYAFQDEVTDFTTNIDVFPGTVTGTVLGWYDNNDGNGTQITIQNSKTGWAGIEDLYAKLRYFIKEKANSVINGGVYLIGDGTTFLSHSGTTIQTTTDPLNTETSWWSWNDNKLSNSGGYISISGSMINYRLTLANTPDSATKWMFSNGYVYSNNWPYYQISLKPNNYAEIGGRNSNATNVNLYQLVETFAKN